MLATIIERGNGGYPYMRRGQKIINEDDLDLGELIKIGRFFSKCGGYISTMKGVSETLECNGWVIFKKK